MANIKSAKKRILVINRKNEENKFFKATVNTYTKKFRKLVNEGNFVEAEKMLKETISLINSSASKGIFHKNNASRKVARLSAMLDHAKTGKKQIVVEPVKAVKAKEVKTAVKAKPVVVEAPAVEEVKKPVAKKAAVKAEVVAEEKPVAKKATAKKATTEDKPATAKKTTAKKEATEDKPVAKKTTTRAKKAE